MTLVEKVAKDLYERARHSANLLHELLSRFVENPDERYELWTEKWAAWEEASDIIRKIYLIEATRLLQAILADPSIVEIDTKAELPKIAYWNEDKQETYYGDLPTWCTDAFIKAGWVKPKER